MGMLSAASIHVSALVKRVQSGCMLRNRFMSWDSTNKANALTSLRETIDEGMVVAGRVDGAGVCGSGLRVCVPDFLHELSPDPLDAIEALLLPKALPQLNGHRVVRHLTTPNQPTPTVDGWTATHPPATFTH